MTPQEQTAIRDQRIRAAFNVETPDRIPIWINGQGFFKWLDPKATLADYFRRPEYVDDLQLEAAKLPDIAGSDVAPMVGFVNEPGQQAFAAMYYAKIRLPGRELEDDSLWNIDELGPMTEQDYDTVIEKGWEHVQGELYARIGFDPSKMPPPNMEYLGPLFGRVAELGKSSINITSMPPFAPFEALSGARKLNNFIRDLRRFPDKMKAAMEIIDNATVEQTVKIVQAAPPSDFMFLGGSRAGSSFISPKTFEQFYFPYFQKLIPAMQKIGKKVWLHMDNEWTAFLHYFREFDKGTIIWDPDQMTDIMKIKEVLGDKFCITGSIPPAMFTVATPDEAYECTKKQCADMGKTGFILAPGCSVPIDAKRENVAAVIAAGLDA